MQIFIKNMVRTMDIYIGPLPENITYQQVRTFLKGFEKHLSFDIRCMENEDEKIFYALVKVSSARIAQKIIAKLNSTLLRDKPVLVREFVHRASGNDRRAVGWRNNRWKFFNRRDAERRKNRHEKVMEDIWAKANKSHNVLELNEGVAEGAA